ncbi:MAG: CoA transferase [Chloroflexi bacterium]|nr:CoA transferase [Chloroflexota bacterium]MCY3696236.1 CoA transferase [Chloroflexota bacterium]
MSQTTQAALSPYRVIDLTAEIGGLSTKLLAGLGADVIRIEPPGGHVTRRRGPMQREDEDSSLYWVQMNAGKRSIVLDLDQEQDHERLRALCETADFLFESDAPGAMAARGLGYDDLRERAPQLIYVSITPFGQTGPKSMWAASDLIGHVSGGLSSLVGDPDRAPLRPSVEQAYNITALNAGSAALIALHARHLSGRGQHVDVSMQAAMANTLGNARLYYEMDGIVTERAGGARAFADRATRIIYRCIDGYVAFVRIPASMKALHRWMTAEGADPRFDAEKWAGISIAGNNLPSDDEVAELESEIEAFFAARGAQSLYESGQHHGVMICPVNTMQDIVDSPQLAARGFFDEIDDPELGRLTVPGAPLKMSATPWQTRPAPTLGQHQDEILTAAATEVRDGD